MDSVVLPNGTQISRAVVVGIVTQLQSLLSSGDEFVVKELVAKAEDHTVALSNHSIMLLTARAMATSNGVVHDNILALIPYVVTVTADRVRIVDLWAQSPEKDSLQQAVESLEKFEIGALLMGYHLLGRISDKAGYEKVAAFCQDGTPTPELIAALTNEMARRN